ncbi:unnamed protein product [Rotaria sp. Silwood2]|nr:unnamed protein product [Rotaria sp. Silwood2]CAF4539509.1 unnamed protein product [Rotaria sp. Silwood2]
MRQFLTAYDSNCDDSKQFRTNSSTGAKNYLYHSFLMYRLVPKCRLNFKATAQKPVEYKYGSRSVAIGDFDNDTVLDMVVANHIVNNIAVYLGNGDGSFRDPTMYSTGSYSSPYMVIVADFNNDNRLDIAVANFGTKK